YNHYIINEISYMPSSGYSTFLVGILDSEEEALDKAYNIASKYVRRFKGLDKTSRATKGLEQLAQLEQPIQPDSGRGQKSTHQRGLKAGYSISNLVKGLSLTRYPIHPKH
ncbi:MAG: hypothetical protein AABW67_04015, partial [Nanoarchaeota archaeon]